MDSDTNDSLDLEELRQKLVGAERKYYTNLHVLQEKLARLEAFQTLSKLLVPCTNPVDALAKLAELSIQYMGVEKAIVIQPIESGYEITALKGYSRRQAGEVQQVVISGENRHIRRTVEEKTSILLDTVDGELADKLDLSQMILCPLHSEEGVFFGLYIVGFSEKKKGLFRPFDLSDVDFFDTIGAQVSALLQNFNLRDSFKRFVPFEFLALLEKTSIQDVNASDNVSLNMHVMFTDLRDFTLMSESMGPEAVFALLNEYLGVMEPQIASAGGFINQYQGDAIMALFSGESDRAVQGAIRMWEALGTLNKERAKRGEKSLRIGIGINSGELLLGAIGSTKRLDSNVVGDAPNLASRVEGMTKVYGARVLISGSTHAHLSRLSDFTLRELDRVIVAGKTEPVEVYELLDVDPEELRKQKTRGAARFAQGLLCYRAGEFRDARLIFADCLVKAPLDEAAALYIGRCVELIARPPAGVWDGTTVLSGK
ncbi:adenylate/guanylate cyclase domain-containing protein [Gammaproteobacteria bacterium]|nr:adenylate/guanylate cyclase domain-containing protein [Gammaproteobacteria bacterium]